MDKRIQIPKEKAAALAYEHTGAPRVVAKGEGYIAQKIIEKAGEQGIPIQKNEALVNALMLVELSGEIPVELYEVVAQVLAFIYRLNKSKVKQVFDQDS
nr:EscU/YscU/HrcU family type III secretion system export apparatus switch protein [Syntrophobotulus glycolicus]